VTIVVLTVVTVIIITVIIVAVIIITVIIVVNSLARLRGESFQPYIMSGGAKFWQGKALSNMPIFRIRMAEQKT
jgi:hypothetical protein